MARGLIVVGIETVLTQLDVTPTKAVLWEYGFDWLDRLVTVKRAEAVVVASLPASPLGPTALQRSYVFDESDNSTLFANEVLPKVDHVNDVTYYYKYKSIDDNGTTRYSDQLEEILIYENAAGHRIVGDFDSFESLEHDLDGNLTQRTITSTGEEISYQWTALDRLKRVESSANGRMQDARYDVNGLRERKLASGALTQFKNGNSSVEYGVGISTAASGPGATNSAAPSITYISGHMIMGAEIDGTFVFHLGDALSTVRDVVEHTGTVIKSFEFDEYGNRLNSTGTGATSPKTWIGGLSVNDDRADSGMFNMGHRNYAAGVLGRFVSRDPIGFSGGLNLYNYPSNPVSFTDSTGLRWEHCEPYDPYGHADRIDWRDPSLPSASTTFSALSLVAVLASGPGAGLGGFLLRAAIGGKGGAVLAANTGESLAAWRGVSDDQVQHGLSFFPKANRGQGQEILNFFKEIYPDVTEARCGNAAAELEKRLDKKFGNDPRFKGFEFEFQTQHQLGIPMNMAMVKIDGQPIVSLYAGSDLGGGPGHVIWKP